MTPERLAQIEDTLRNKVVMHPEHHRMVREVCDALRQHGAYVDALEAFIEESGLCGWDDIDFRDRIAVAWKLREECGR